MKRMTFLGILLSIIVLAGVSSANAVVLIVDIDIKPESNPNSINLRSAGVIPVAILGSEVFDVLEIDYISVEFGPFGAAEVHEKGHEEDANEDGFLDLVFHFYTQETGIACGDIEATLTGETLDGIPIEGTDAVDTLNCN